mgnify:CR=1 FL=1
MTLKCKINELGRAFITVAIHLLNFNLVFAIFYEIFVVACFVHTPIGLANILQETFPKKNLAKPLSLLLAMLILALGTTAVIGVFTGGQL